jgi:AcrR family transcriptional regulator
MTGLAVRAFAALLAAKSFDEISVAQIARRARSSVGGVYARFATKDALLLPVLDDLLGDSLAVFEPGMDAVSGPDATLTDVVTAYVTPMIAMFRKHRAVMLQVVRAARGDTAHALQEKIHAFNLHVHSRFRTLAWAHRAEIRHPDPRAAIEMALFFGSASARDGIAAPNWMSYEIRPDDATLAREIIAAMLAYLDASGVARKSRRSAR